MISIKKRAQFYIFFLCYLAAAFGLIGCKRSGFSVLTADRKPFFIKGAGGHSHMDVLRDVGGNTVRTWDTVNLAQILDSAAHQQLKVMAGFYIVDPAKFESFYDDSAKVNAQFRSVQKIIKRYKSHPSLLMWCVGNELDFPISPFAFKFYNAYNRIIDMIHADDPNHPATTAVYNFSRKAIINLRLRTDIDILSFNIYNNSYKFKEELNEMTWFWNGPYLLSEWGIDGPWEGTAHTIWGAYIEPSSTQKAKVYAERYLTDMPVKDSRFLGSFIFYWGHKQETTHTWFSLFEENGARSETINKLRFIWKKESSPFEAPQIDYMLLNKRRAADNILLNSKTISSAAVQLLAPVTDSDRVVWELYPEDWYQSNQRANRRFLKPINVSIRPTGNLAVQFEVPEQEGPYRLFATIYDKHGNFSTCNTPFYVLNK
jgi:hypothetical protein